MSRMTLREAAEALVATWPPLTDEQVEAAARILAAVEPERAEGLATKRPGQESVTTA